MRIVLLVTLLLLCAAAESTARASDPTDDLPTPVPLVDIKGYDILNIMLLGSDTSNPRNSGRTDVIMVVSINRTANTVALLSVPRDLYVYVPGYQWQRINTTYGFGELSEQGTGAQVLAEAIKDNLGLVVDYYARVDFEQFKSIIDAVGGVDLSVDCAIQDWRLRDPQLDPTDEANWVKYTLPIGVQHLDGDLALWYARSRKTSSDIDRGVRQQEILRALWRHISDLGLVSQLSDFWPQLTEIVRTDIPLPEMLRLVPVALSLDESRIASFTFRLGVEVTSGRAPDGAQILLLQPDATAKLMHDFMSPQTRNQLQERPTTVRVVNGSGAADLGRVVADKLSWHGFVVTLSPDVPDQFRQTTVLYDHTGTHKGRALETLQSILRVGSEDIIYAPEATREYDYEIVVGSSYYACTRNVLAPLDINASSQG